jgi:hypothetical protein
MARAHVCTPIAAYPPRSTRRNWLKKTAYRWNFEEFSVAKGSGQQASMGHNDGSATEYKMSICVKY